jgi:trimeric autotransporter adhesin
MKKCMFFLFLAIGLIGHSQVSITNDGSLPDNSAMLDIKSTEKGMLVPRMTTTQRTAIASPAAGLLVFDNTTNSFWFYNGSSWTNLTASGGTGWLLTGNTATDTSVNFIGTTDNMPLYFKINNSKVGVLSNDNVLIGKGAGNSTTSTGIIAIGRGTLSKNTDRIAITAIGDSALYNNGTGASGSLNGNYNTAVGTKSLKYNTTGYDNVSVGDYSLYKNTTGIDNTAVGSDAMGANQAGYQNAAFGSSALVYNQSGANNTAVGFASSRSGISGNNNTSAGIFSLFNNVTGNNNVAIGAMALRNQLNISSTVAVGDSSLFNNSGAQNTAVGSKALLANTTGDWNTALGFNSLYSNTTGHNNTGLGTQSLNFNTTGWNNTASGTRSLYSNQTGSQNTASGINALYSNTTADNNTATGFNSLYSNNTGTGNTANGMVSLFSNTTGSSNTADGSQSLLINSSGEGNTASGFASLYSNQTGSFNTANGYNSLDINTTGFGNTSMGSVSLHSNSIGDYNTALGYAADVNQGNLSNATAIGARARVDASNSMVLGSVYNINGSGSNVNVGIGTTTPAAALDVRRDPNNNGSSYATAYFAGTTNISHFNFGINQDTYIRGGLAGSNVIINDITNGKTGVGTSSPITTFHIKMLYTVNPDGLMLERDVADKWITGVDFADDYSFYIYNGSYYPYRGYIDHVSGNYYAVSDISLKEDVQSLAGSEMLSKVMMLNPAKYHFKDAGNQSYYFGFISQEVENIFPEFVGDKEGVKMMNYTSFIPILTKAMQEQQAMIEDLKSKNDELLKRIEKLENK